MIYVYGTTHNDRKLCDRAIDFLENIDPEKNSLIRDWESAGLIPESAYYSQALLQLTENYCRRRRCLDCRIGCGVISSGKSLKSNSQLSLEP